MPFFRTEKPKQFTFIPRFYDERKEQLNNRIDDIKKDVEESRSGEYVPNIRGRMRSRHDDLYGKSERKGKTLISRRLITILFIGMVLLIGYYILRMLVIADKI